MSSDPSRVSTQPDPDCKRSSLFRKRQLLLDKTNPKRSADGPQSVVEIVTTDAGRHLLAMT